MARVTITFTDTDDGGCSMTADFDPPIDSIEAMTDAQKRAVIALNSLDLDEADSLEYVNPDGSVRAAQ